MILILKTVSINLMMDIICNLEGINSIIIRDNGHGIEQEQLKVKFTPMFESEKRLQ